MYDDYCEDKYCKFCDLPKPKLSLRGACINEKLDIDYVMQLDQMIERKYQIIGLKQSKLLWQEDKWAFINGDDDIVAFTNDTTDYPLGTHRWYFTSQRWHNVGEKWIWNEFELL